MLHYMITNREIISENGTEYIRKDGKEEAADEIRFAIIDSETKAYTLIPDTFFNSNPNDNEDAFTNTYSGKYNPNKLEELTGSERMFAQLYFTLKDANNGGDVLLFIHGFNNDLEDSIEELIKIEKALIKQGSPIKHLVLFSWPSRNNLLKYRDDHRDAELSGYALGRAYDMLRDFFIKLFGRNPEAPKNEPCTNNIHIMCHSKGNFVLENMMIKLNNERRPTNALFEEVILTGSDVDWQVFEEPRAFYRLTEICRRVHIYHHRKDRALGISETTKNGSNRLGKYGPRDIRKIPSHVYVIDVTGIKDQKGIKDKSIDHWYHLSSKKVQTDFIEVLKGTNAENLKTRERLSPTTFRLS